METGIELIAIERKRQVEKEGWTQEHDNNHTGHELSMAAALYAAPVQLYQKMNFANQVTFNDPWPWEQGWDKRPKNGNVLCDPTTSITTEGRIKNLVKAGALIAAEIDRLQNPTT